MPADAVLGRLTKSRDEMAEVLAALCRIPAMGPENGGEGEGKKAKAIEALLKELDLKVERFDSPDERVPGGKRPNLVARVGKGPRLWFLCHMDVVPPGGRKAWRVDPFDPKVMDGRLFGRGTEDNGQSLVAVLWAYRALLKGKEKPGRPLGFALVADEEAGSTHGVKFLLTRGIFGEKDVFLAPDRGVGQGDEIEVAEKHLLWLRVTVRGKQAHASRPDQGLNAHRAGAFLVTLIDATLPKRFHGTDPIFRPWSSTFEPTKKEPNVPNVNTIPAEDVFYFDCRLLPTTKPKEVLGAARELGGQTEKTFGVKVAVDVVQEETSPPTPADAPLVTELVRAIQKTRGLRAKPVGIGGGTVAAPLRRAGFPVAVWETTDETAHEVNEYAKLDNLVADAKVFATLMLGPV